MYSNTRQYHARHRAPWNLIAVLPNSSNIFQTLTALSHQQVCRVRMPTSRISNSRAKNTDVDVVVAADAAKFGKNKYVSKRERERDSEKQFSVDTRQRFRAFQTIMKKICHS